MCVLCICLLAVTKVQKRRKSFQFCHLQAHGSKLQLLQQKIAIKAIMLLWRIRYLPTLCCICVFLPVRYKQCWSPNPGPGSRIHKISYSWPFISRAIGSCPEPMSYAMLCFSAIRSKPWLCLTMDPTNTCHDPGAEEAAVLPGNDWDCSGTEMGLGLSLVWKWAFFERKIHVSGKKMKYVMLHASAARKWLSLRVSSYKIQSKSCFPIQAGTGVCNRKMSCRKKMEMNSSWFQQAFTQK